VTNKAFFNYIDMNVVNPNDTTHVISIVPRYNLGEGVATLNLYNEVTQLDEDIEFTYLNTDGKWTVSFVYTFNEGDRYQIRITENLGVAYRGKIFATSQNPQQYYPTLNAYYY